LEFTSALEAALDLSSDKSLSIDFVNALDYTGQAVISDVDLVDFNEAMQYVTFPDNEDIIITRDSVIAAVERCSLVHAVYEVIASGVDIHELAPLAIEDGGFEDMYKGGPNEHTTWCFRARNYGDLARTGDGKEKRSGDRARSLSMESEGLKALKDLLIRFGGKVDLLQPVCKIYIFDGLKKTKKVLTRQLAVGPKVRAILATCTFCCHRTLNSTLLFALDIFDSTSYTYLYYQHPTLPNRFIFSL
jgi:hypothetical protein